MTTTVGAMTKPFDVYIRPVRSGRRRFWRSRAWSIGTADVVLPVHTETDYSGHVKVTSPTTPELLRALSDSLRGLADEADRVAIEEARDER